MNQGNPQQLYDLITEIAHVQSTRLNGVKLHYLEIGTQEGGSVMAAFDSKCIDLAILIDTWGNNYGGTGRGSPDHVIARLGEQTYKNTIILTGDSRIVVPSIKHKFDFIFIDGDHSAGGCRLDMSNCLSLLENTGVILVDDMDHHQHSYLRQVVGEFATAHELNVVYHPAHFGVAELRYKL